MNMKINFCVVQMMRPDGVLQQALLGFGDDDTVWIEPHEIGIGPDKAEALARYKGIAMISHPASQCVFVNAFAVAETITNPELRSRWLTHTTSLIKKHKELRSQYESTRNN